MPADFSLTGYAYAHRGLWDADTPENCLAAFRKAAMAGFGAECDIHLSADGVPMVFHDNRLDRMTGRSGLISEAQSATLMETPLLSSDETIPTLDAALREMNGLPMLIELKSGPSTERAALALAVADLLQRSSGLFAVMSFDPDLLARVRDHCGTVCLGLLLDPEANGRRRDLPHLQTSLQLTFLGPHISRFDETAAYARSTGLELVCWTIRSDSDFRKVQHAGAAPVFENLTFPLVRPHTSP